LVPTGERWGSLTISSPLAFAEGLFVLDIFIISAKIILSFV